jgi:hypothetical protein
MSTDGTCQTRGKPLEQAKTGRPRKYCSEACRSRDKRARSPLGALARRVSGRPETPRAEPVSPTAEPASSGLAPQGARLEQVRRLGRALAKVKTAEEQLAAANASRAALEPVNTEPHFTATYKSLEEMRAAHGGGGIPPGRDTSAIAAAIRQQSEVRRQADG